MLYLLTKLKTTVIAACIGLLVVTGSAQTTQFTYQGRLTDSNLPSPTNGTYEMRFRAFDAPSGGNQLPTVVNLPTVQVVNGVFTVQLDLGSAGFNGQPIYLEIAARPAGSVNPITVLNPRQQVTSAPYAIQSANANTANDSANLGGIPANQYVQTGDQRLSDARNPLPGSQSYIQNGTAFQLLSNFNISGGGSASSFTASGQVSGNTVNSATLFKIGGTSVLSTPNATSVVVGQSSNHTIATANNAFFGYKAGQAANGFSQANTFIGSDSGETTTSGGNNVFVGRDSGFSNSTGSLNSFFGSGAGQANTSASGNSFFGYFAGHGNTTGSKNSSFGFQAGQANIVGTNNAYFGYQAGNTTTNDDNAFFGALAGAANTTGGRNTFVGSSAGSNNVTGADNTAVGYGTQTNSGGQNTYVGSGAGGSGNNNTTLGYGSITVGSDDTAIGHKGINGGKTHATAIGADAVADSSNTIMLGTALDTVEVPNDLQVTGNSNANDFHGNTLTVGTITSTGGTKTVLMVGGSTQVCQTVQGFLSQCSSSLRYKKNVAAYRNGLGTITRLRPITFDWKDGGMHDLGFGAEEVARIDPLLVVYDKNGRVEGVKYDRISAALVNAVKEQQAQITDQKQRLDAMQVEIAQMKRLMTGRRPSENSHRRHVIKGRLGRAK
jgi:hypothetical protein